jgi:predicted Holliday junction resolvase-like endonuclease
MIEGFTMSTIEVSIILFSSLLAILIWWLGLLSSRLNNHKNEISILESTIVTKDLEIENLLQEVKKHKSRAGQQAAKKGQAIEKWTPFLKADGIEEHWKAEDWNFIGNPLDYLVFDWHQDSEKNLESGGIYFVEVKVDKSNLTTKQRRIRDLIKEGKVHWRLVRLD